jgi:iron complex outermembrane receptor protein
VRLLSQGDGPFKWILGVYAFHLDGYMDLDVTNSAGPTLPVVITRLLPKMQTTSYAGFVEGTYNLTSDLFLTVGVRYTTEDRKFSQTVNGTILPFGTAERSFNKWTYRAALRYNFADDANVYVTYGTGFKSGVFNAVGTSRFSTDPEEITSWEGGIKADPLPWLRTNLSIYHYDYKDLQVQARDAITSSYILQNAANAKIWGGELEVTVSPTADFNLRGAFSYTHGEYSSFPLAQTFTPRPDGGNTVSARDVSGNRIIRTPRTSFNVGFDLGHDLGGGCFMVMGNVFHSGRVYHDFQNIFSQKPYTMASGEISWTTPNERWRFSLWGKNITNAAVFQQIRPGALSADGFEEAPRRVGIGAEFKF